MSLLGNIVWFLLGGFLAALGYWLAGLLACLTVVGIPFGVQLFKLGTASLAPFGKEIVEGPQTNTTLRVLFNILWIVLFGWELAVGHLVFALVLALTIVGLPFARQHIKLLPLSLMPFGRALR